MRKILLSLMASILVISLSAQVTIGSDVKPRSGAILDLKENAQLGANSTKGLSLPRVQLTTISSLDDIALGLNKDNHTGLTIYVPEAFENSCPGVYVWSGAEWQGINTDVSKSPEFITVDDIDGNTYTAKIFNRKGCTGGVYWFTSNLRTTRFNDGATVTSTKNFDGTPVSPTRNDNMPMFFGDGKVNTWEIPPYDVGTNTNYFDETNTKLNFVRTKSDISTSTAADKMIEYYENNVKQRLTQDQFVTKFGLLYIYNMAFDGNYKGGGTIVERKLCPEGWKIPTVMDWLNVAMDTGAPNITEAQYDAAEYLGVTDFIKGVDEDEVFAPENLNQYGGVDVDVYHPYHGNKSGWFLFPAKVLSTGAVRNSGLNVQPVGRVTLPSSIPPAVEGGLHGFDTFYGQHTNFGSHAFFLNVTNGAIYIRGYRNSIHVPETITPQMGGGAGAKTFSSVRCIKVVE